VGEIGFPAPKEQPPRKLSGKRTTGDNTLKNGDVLLAPTPADGITLSGTQTEGAPMPNRLMFGILTCAYRELL